MGTRELRKSSNVPKEEVRVRRFGDLGRAVRLGTMGTHGALVRFAPLNCSA